MLRKIVFITMAIGLIIAPGACLSLTVQDVVNQISTSSYQDYLTNTLPTHSQDNRAFNMGVSNGVVQHGAQHDVAADNIYTAFRRSGLLTSYDPFSYYDDSGITWNGRNVIAVKQGTTRPDDIYIVGSHYDSTASRDGSWTHAPGADDNGSGVAGLLEIARALAPYQFEATIVFAAFDGEEVQATVGGAKIPRLGSMHYADEHASDNILGMISMDMIGWATPYSRDPSTGEDLRNKADIEARTSMTTIIADLSSAINTYGGGLRVDVRGNPGDYSDHVSFANKGFQAVQFIEDGWWSNPNYHRQTDSIDTANYIDWTYSTKMLKSATGYFATAAQLDGSFSPVVPEPAGLLALASGIIGAFTLLRRKRTG